MKKEEKQKDFELKMLRSKFKRELKEDYDFCKLEVLKEIAKDGAFNLAIYKHKSIKVLTEDDTILINGVFVNTEGSGGKVSKNGNTIPVVISLVDSVKNLSDDWFESCVLQGTNSINIHKESVYKNETFIEKIPCEKFYVLLTERYVLVLYECKEEELGILKVLEEELIKKSKTDQSKSVTEKTISEEVKPVEKKSIKKKTTLKELKPIEIKALEKKLIPKSDGGGLKSQIYSMADSVGIDRSKITIYEAGDKIL